MLSSIVAMAENGIIGCNNRLPWHLPDDLKFFREITWGKPILMGHKTFQSIGRPLPYRTNIVLAHGAQPLEGCTVVSSLPQALSEVMGKSQELIVIGGASVYTQTLPYIKRLYLTQIKACVEGDVYFPSLDWRDWQEVWRKEHPSDGRHAFAFYHTLLVKKGQN